MAATVEETINLIQSNKAKFENLRRRIQKSNSISSVLFLGKKTLPSELVNEEVIAEIIHILDTDPTVTSLVLSNTAIKSPADQVAILKSACNAPNLKNLELYGIKFKDVPQEVLQKLASLPLTALCLYAYPGPDEIFTFSTEVAHLVFQNKTLASLRVANMALSRDAVRVMAETSHLQTLILHNTNISNEDLIMLLSKGNISLLEIEQESNDVRSEPPMMPADLQHALLNNTTLEHFYSPYSIAPFVKELDARLELNRKNNLSSQKITYIHREGLDIFSREHVHPELYDEIAKGLKDVQIDVLKRHEDIAEFKLNAFWTDHGSYDRNLYLHTLIANEHKVKIVLKFLREMKGSINPHEFDFEWKNLLIISAKVYSADEVFKDILQIFGKELDLNANDIYGRTPLHYICAYGKLNLLQTLLSSDLSPDLLIEDFEGRTALDYCELQDAEIEEILDSIEINPARDANATQNDLETFIKTLDPDFDLGFIHVSYEEIQYSLSLYLQQADQCSKKHQENVQLYEEFKQSSALIEQLKDQKALIVQFNEACLKQKNLGDKLDEAHKALKLLNTQSDEAKAKYEKILADNKFQAKVYNSLHAVPTIESLRQLKSVVLELIKDKEKQEKLEQAYTELEKGFAGISVIAKIKASRQGLKALLLQKILEIHGGKSTLKTTPLQLQNMGTQILQSSVNSGIEAPNQQAQPSLLLLQEAQQAQAVDLSIASMLQQQKVLEKSSLPNKPESK